MPHTKTLTTLALLTLAACGDPGPMTGGPCTYETSITPATVVTVDADGALFDSAEGEVFVAAGDLPALPAPGEPLPLQIERILTGPCTPEIVTVVEAG